MAYEAESGQLAAPGAGTANAREQLARRSAAAKVHWVITC